jgi:hypothetical protein
MRGFHTGLHPDTLTHFSIFFRGAVEGLWDNQRCSGGSQPRWANTPAGGGSARGVNEAARTPDEDS